MKDRKAVVTGVGIICAAGAGREALREALRKPAPLTADAGLRLPAGLVRNFDIREYIETEKGYLDRTSQLAFAGMSLALEDANLSREDVQKAEAGLFLGTAFGNHQTMALFFEDLLAKGPRFVKPILFPHAYSNTTISLLAMEYGLTGWHVNFAAGGISGAAAILSAFDLIRTGRLDMALAGGVDSLTEMLVAGLQAEKLVSSNPCKPFDAARDGFNPGEACVVLVLEEGARARRRGARPLADVLGAGLASMNRRQERSPAENAICRAMESALASGGATPDMLVASANGTSLRDEAEWKAVAALAERMPGLSMTSLKPLFGETFGAEGPLQVAAAIECLGEGIVPPALNLERQLGAPPLPIVSGTAKAPAGARALVNSFDDGGSAVSILLGKPS